MVNARLFSDPTSELVSRVLGRASRELHWQCKQNQIQREMAHILLPLDQRDKRYVQVDILFSKWPTFSKWWMTSPDPSRTKWKAAHRNQLFRAVAKTATVQTLLQQDSEPVKWSQEDIDSMGIWLTVQTLVDERGKRLKWPGTDQKLWPSYARVQKKIPITHSPNQCVKRVLGEKFTTQSFQTYEDLLEIVQEDPDFKWREIRDDILFACAKSIAQNKRLQLPEELQKLL